MTRRASVLAWAACAALLLPCWPAPAQSLRDPRADALEWRQRPGAALPLDLPLRDERGGETTLRAASGGLPFVLAPGYFRCGYLCGVVRDDLFAALARTGLRAGQDYAAVVLSIDPAEGAADAAAARQAALLRYGAVPGAEEGWRFLTGTAGAVGAVAEEAGFPAQYDAAARQFLHPAGILAASPAGQVSSYVMGVGYAPDELLARLSAARDGTAAPGGPVADGMADGVAQAVLLLCGQLGIEAGRLTPLVMAVLRGAAACAALLLGLWLLWLRRTPTLRPPQRGQP